MSPPRTLPHDPRQCRFCRQPLSRLDRVRGDVCSSLDCRRALVDETRAAERDADLAARRRAAQRRWQAPALAAAPVVWLKPFEVRIVPLRAAERRAHVAYLQALAETPPSEADATPRADPAPGPPVAGRVCAFCAGRCCELGGHTHAFIKRMQFVRWVEDHPGGSLADAARDYGGRLPATHVEGSCVYHGRSGCVLPREMRADICNHYLCDPLRAAQAHAQRQPDAGVVVAMPRVSSVQRAAWARDDALRPLLRRPRPLTTDA